MAEQCSVELNKNLYLLEQNFLMELRKIAEQRLELEKKSTSNRAINLEKKIDLFREDGRKKLPPIQNFAVRLESSLQEKLAKSRGTADELEDKLQETRIAFEDKVKTIQQMKSELDRRENVLVQSVQQIEIYLRAIFYLKREADDMGIQLKNTLKKQEKTSKELKNDKIELERKKESLKKEVANFLPAKIALKRITSELTGYSNLKELVEYYLVLNVLQEDFLNREAEFMKSKEILTKEKLQLKEYERKFPIMVVSKESVILELKEKLTRLRSETAHFEEQMDDAIFLKVKDDAAWYDVQRWIRKIFHTCVEIRPLGPEEPSSGILNMLDRIKDFTAIAMEMAERLKRKKS